MYVLILEDQLIKGFLLFELAKNSYKKKYLPVWQVIFHCKDARDTRLYRSEIVQVDKTESVLTSQAVSYQNETGANQNALEN